MPLRNKSSDPESIRARSLKFDPRWQMSIMAIPSKTDLYLVAK